MKSPLGNIMKQAQAMQENLKKAQDELAQIEVTGGAGGTGGNRGDWKCGGRSG